MEALPVPRLMPDILQEHFEELGILWERRNGVIQAPDWTLQRLADLEERAEAHLDGLRIGAGHSADVARPALAGELRSAAAAAALTMMALGSAELEVEVVTALAGAASPEARDGIRIGLRHSDVTRVVNQLAQMGSAGEPATRAAASDVLAFHRMHPPQRFTDLLGVPDPPTRVLVYGAVGRFGGPWNPDLIEEALERDEPEIRRSALECSARLGLSQLGAICRQAATRRNSPVLEAMRFLGVLALRQDFPLLEAAARQNESPAAAVAAIRGLGCFGSVRAVPALLNGMIDPNLAHAAGAAFMRITGARGIEADKPLQPPELFPRDGLDFPDDTPSPDPERARAWWEREKGKFAPEGRWQAGEDVSKGPLGECFRILPLAIRRDLYLGLRARNQSETPDLDLEERAAVQSRTLAAQPRMTRRSGAI